MEEENEWRMWTDSPFTSVIEDLARFYFFNYWCSEGKFPPVGGVHDRIHRTDWFAAGLEDKRWKCPGPEAVDRLCKRYREEIS